MGSPLMDIDVPDWAPKVSWLLHFTFSSWALLSGFISVTIYSYSQLVMLIVGAWVIFDKNRADAVFLYFSTILITILNDIIVLSIYTQRGVDTIEDANPSSEVDQNTFRFALIMTIANLILKPFTAFIMFKQMQDSSSDDGSNSNSNSNSSHNYSGGRGGYQNLEAERPPKDDDQQSEHQYVDLHDDPKDRPPNLPARNQPQNQGGSSQGSEASSYYSTNANY